MERSGDSDSGRDRYRAISLESSETIPNNPDLPLIVYRNIVEDGPSDPSAHFEERYQANDWGGTWRNGIFSFHHYHSTAHEVLGIARGEAQVLFGGPGGREVHVSAGDAAVLPAGTGHKRETASRDLLVVGGYPRGQDADLRRADSSPTDDILEAIQSVDVPDTDPLFGSGGPLTVEWS